MIRIYARLQYLPDYIQTLVTTNTKFNPLFTIFRNASVRTIYNVRNSKSKRYSSFDTIHDRTYRARLRKLSINYRASTLILSNFVIERRIIITLVILSCYVPAKATKILEGTKRIGRNNSNWKYHSGGPL